MGQISFSKSFKENAVKLSFERNSIKELAQELGISPNLLSKWRKEYLKYGEASFQGRGIERLNDEQRKIKDLEKALKNKKMEIEIFKRSRLLKDRRDKYLFIDENRERYPVEMMAKILGVSPRAYYNYKNTSN
ncbi:MAG: transposase [Rikenellaceae bacterium]